MLDIFVTFLKLGLTSFGGPTAHIGYYRETLVERRRWLDEHGLADLVAVSQMLPGPASTQITIAVGALRGGPLGGALAWLGFTLPSALLMIAFAHGAAALGGGGAAGWLAGFKIAALAVVSNAVLGMATTLAPDRARATLAVLAAGLVIVLPGVVGQLAAIGLGAAAGAVLFRDVVATATPLRFPRLGRRTGIVCLALAGALLLALPLAAALVPGRAPALVDGLYRTGALVFGGGHVVLPLLESVVVPPGWVDRETFVAGYGAAQALPGPLFSIAAFVGAAMAPGWPGFALAFAGLVAIFLPGFLLMLGVIPFWAWLGERRAVRAALTGVNAAVVGLLAAALYDPVWTSAVAGPIDFVLALAGFVALRGWRAPSWAVVAALAAGRALVAA